MEMIGEINVTPTVRKLVLCKAVELTVVIIGHKEVIGLAICC